MCPSDFMNTKTPLTDAELQRMAGGGCPGVVTGDFAKQIEYKLVEAKEKLSQCYLLGALNLTEQDKKDLRKEITREREAFGKLLAERDLLRKVAANLASALKEISWHKTTTPGLFRAFATTDVIIKHTNEALVAYNSYVKEKQS